MPQSKGPKVVVVGAGSMFFGRQAVSKMVQSEVLRDGTLALVDTDRPTLDRILTLAKKAAQAAGAPTRIIGSTDRCEVLEGADFVILTFADRGIHFRGIDTRISAKYGVNMCSSDTIGPGGIFRTLREGPVVLEVARDVERLCPDAWVINYINPTACLGILLMRHAPKLKSFALCDGHHEPHTRRHLLRVVRLLGLNETDPELEARADIAVLGVNHFTWIIRFQVDGKDYLPAYLDHLRSKMAEDDWQTYSKRRKNRRYMVELAEIFGAIPDCIGHTKEYVPYYQRVGVTGGLEPISLFDSEERAAKRADIYREIDQYIAGEKPMSEFLEKTPADHATDIIESMWGRMGKPFYINQPNRGAVSNLPADAFLELRSELDMNGPRPFAVGEAPLGLRGLTMQVLDTHELTVEAAVSCDRNVLRRAMLTDPIVNSVSDADAIIAEMLVAQRDALPEGWFK